MLCFEFTPDDKSIFRDYADVTMEWSGCEDLDVEEHLDKFKIFLRALGFTEHTVKKLQVIENSQDCKESQEE